MDEDAFRPERMARAMLDLHPEMAHQIVISLQDDALVRGDSERATLWWKVLVRIEAHMARQGKLAPPVVH